MTRTEKAQEIQNLKNILGDSNFFYVADSSTMTVEEISNFRRRCYEKGVKVKVVKNTLAIKALEALENDSYSDIYDVFKGQSTLMITETANVPAKLLKAFRKETNRELPTLKAAYIDQSIFRGDDQILALAALKSKEELIGEIVLLLQSPIKNVIGSLNSGKHTLAGLVKALEERGND